MSAPLRPLTADTDAQDCFEVLRVLIVDDEPLALMRLRVALREVAGVQVVGAAGDGVEAASLIRTLKPDLIFIDVEMPQVSGLEVVERLRAPDAPEVVFVTAFDRYALAAFDVQPADYLIKPFRLSRLGEAVGRARVRLRSRRLESERPPVEEGSATEDLVFPPIGSGAAAVEPEIWVPAAHGKVRLQASDILWIEAARDYAILHTANRNFILRETMYRLQTRFDPASLLRVHRSALVRLSAVSAVRRSETGAVSLALSNGKTIPVGRKFIRPVLARLQVAAGRAR